MRHRHVLGLWGVSMLLVPLGLACSDDETGGGGQANEGGGGGNPPSAAEVAWQATLDEVETRAEALGIPGVGVAVVLDGKLAFAGGVGVRSRSGGEPVTGDTLFMSSSAASKTVIAAALLDMAEEGLVDLRQPISEIVPEVQLDPEHADEIDLHQVLLQRSGLEASGYRNDCEDAPSVVDFYSELGQLASLAPPGAVWSYTAHGSMMGAAAIETIEGRPFTEVLTERVLTPAGMVTATYDPLVAEEREHAVAHIGSIEEEPGRSPRARCGERIASVGLYASAADHGRFLELLLEPGRLLDQDSLALLEGAAENPGFGPDWSYGYQAYGLHYKGVRVLHHYGTSFGVTAGMSWVPERGFGVVLLTNADPGQAFERSYALEELRWAAADRFLGLTGDPPDESTPPSTWSKYVGTYVDPRHPDVEIGVAQGEDQSLRFTLTQDFDEPVTLTQGTSDAPYQGGDVFQFSEGSRYVIVVFYPDEGGTMRYANAYSQGYGQLVGERVDVAAR